MFTSARSSQPVPEVFSTHQLIECQRDIVIAERPDTGRLGAGPAVLADLIQPVGPRLQAGELVGSRAAGRRDDLAGVVQAVLVAVDVDRLSRNEAFGLHIDAHPKQHPNQHRMMLAVTIRLGSILLPTVRSIQQTNP